jgi:hypothetical protein
MIEMKKIIVKTTDLIKLISGADCKGFYNFTLWEDGTFGTIQKGNWFAETPEKEYVEFGVNCLNVSGANLFVEKWIEDAQERGSLPVQDWDFHMMAEELKEFIMESVEQDENVNWEIEFDDEGINELLSKIEESITDAIEEQEYVYNEKEEKYELGK